MSAFLQRVAATALGATPVLRPRLAPSWAPRPGVAADPTTDARASELAADVADPTPRRPAPNPHDEPAIGAGHPTARAATGAASAVAEGSANTLRPRPDAFVPSSADPVRIARESGTAGRREFLAPDADDAPGPLEPQREPMRPRVRIASEPAAAASSPRTSPAASQAAIDAPQPPDIHIHIGRIDLAAAPTPPVPRRERDTRAPTTTRTLDQYLRGLGG